MSESDFPTAWRPQAGDTLTGKVVMLDEREASGPQRPAYPIVTLQTADGSERSVHCFHFALKKAIVKAQPNFGDELTITYVGKKVSQSSGNEFHDYKVSGGNASAFSWDKYAAEADAELPVRQINEPEPKAAEVLELNGKRYLRDGDKLVEIPGEDLTDDLPF